MTREQKDVTWQDVRTAEEGLLKHSDCTIGLALSGGGIRSATFSLGILQYLAKQRWLSEIDYLSTVSGGGYIGTWLSALIARDHKAGSEQQEQSSLRRDEAQKAKNDDAADAQEKTGDRQKKNPYDATWKNLQGREGRVNNPQSMAVQWIRNHSNYLTPRKGLSGDTFATVGLIITNLFLSIAIVGAIVSAIALIFLLLGQGLIEVQSLLETRQPSLQWYHLNCLLFEGNGPNRVQTPRFYSVFFLLVSVFSVCIVLWIAKKRVKSGDADRTVSSFFATTITLFAAVGTLYLLVCVLLTSFSTVPCLDDLSSYFLMAFAVVAFAGYTGYIWYLAKGRSLLTTSDENSGTTSDQSRWHEKIRNWVLVQGRRLFEKLSSFFDPFYWFLFFFGTVFLFIICWHLYFASGWPTWVTNAHVIWIISGLLSFLGSLLLLEPVRQILDEFRSPDSNKVADTEKGTTCPTAQRREFSTFIIFLSVFCYIVLER